VNLNPTRLDCKFNGIHNIPSTDAVNTFLKSFDSATSMVFHRRTGKLTENWKVDLKVRVNIYGAMNVYQIAIRQIELWPKMRFVKFTFCQMTFLPNIDLKFFSPKLYVFQEKVKKGIKKLSDLNEESHWNRR